MGPFLGDYGIVYEIVCGLPKELNDIYMHNGSFLTSLHENLEKKLACVESLFCIVVSVCINIFHRKNRTLKNVEHVGGPD